MALLKRGYTSDSFDAMSCEERMRILDKECNVAEDQTSVENEKTHLDEEEHSDEGLDAHQITVDAASLEHHLSEQGRALRDAALQLHAHLQDHHCSVLWGPPGAGKTTTWQVRRPRGR